MKIIDDFDKHRLEQNQRIIDSDHRGIKRFFSLDADAYREGALSSREKELMGLVASTALRCNDCIRYHLGRCLELGVSRDQIYEALNISLVVGGSITIPHIRYAFEVMAASESDS